MILSLAYYGSEWLRKKAQPVEKFDETLHELIQDLMDTMEAHKGIGIAATQVKRAKRVFLTWVPEEDEEGEATIYNEPKIYVNPEILSYSDEFLEWNEACLSIPGVDGYVPRPQKIYIRAYDANGNSFEEMLTDFHACNFLHENDHLNGVLFIDRISPMDRTRFQSTLTKLKKKHKKR